MLQKASKYTIILYVTYLLEIFPASFDGKGRAMMDGGAAHDLGKV